MPVIAAFLVLAVPFAQSWKFGFNPYATDGRYNYNAIRHGDPQAAGWFPPKDTSFYPMAARDLTTSK